MPSSKKIKQSKKPFVLTQKNYYSPDRPFISNSQVTDFLKSREYYWRKHVLKEIKTEQTSNMRIGSIVDDIICGSPMRFQVRVLKRDDPEAFEMQKSIPEDRLCTQREWDEAVNHAKAVMREPVFNFYLEHASTFQYVLQGQVDGIPICGMADVLTETLDVVYIDDLKCVGKLKVVTPAKWFYNCSEMRYLNQLAAYKFMYRQMHPNDERKIVCRHLIVTKMDTGFYQVIPFIIPPQLLDLPLEEFKRGVRGISELMKTQNWKDDPVQWEDAIELRNPTVDDDETDLFLDPPDEEEEDDDED